MSSKIQSIFQSLNIKYLTTNDWSGVDKQTRRSKQGRIVGRIDGVEPRLCPEGHILAGQYGLFATKKFDVFDVIGEYTGVVSRENSDYCADLHGLRTDDCLGVDSKNEGNELRFMNDNRGIADSYNVDFKRCFIDTYPRILVVCTKPIEEGEEILTHYSDGFYDHYILKKDEDTKAANSSKTVVAVPTSTPDVSPVPIPGAGAVLVSKVTLDSVYSHEATVLVSENVIAGEVTAVADVNVVA